MFIKKIKIYLTLVRIKLRKNKREMPVVYIGLGSNKGQKIRNIQEAIRRLKEKITVTKISSLYLAEPVGIRGGWFVNCVVKSQSSYSPSYLLRELLKIEEKMGRELRRPGEKKGPRVIDLDILFYGQVVIKESNLVIPHPRLTERKFVLLPLMELDPEISHPVQMKKLKSILNELNDPHRVEKILEVSNGSCQNNPLK